jgi:hypothetical protein
MALEFQIEDITNLPVAAGSLAFFATGGSLIGAMEYYRVPDTPLFWAIAYFAIVAGAFVLIVGTLATRQVRIKDENKRKPVQQKRRPLRCRA